MGNRGERQLNRMLRSAKRRRWQFPMLLCLAILVAVGVAGIFHLPATAKTYQVTRLTCSAVPPEGPASADFFVHIHNDDCYDAEGRLVCPLPEIRPHRHMSDCYITSRELVCGIPESDGHQHTADCYTRVKGDLICELSTEAVLDEEGNVLEEGHVHTDECYAWYDELICGMEEGEGAHHHDDSCYETYTTLICGMSEILLHTHTDDCYQKNEDGSVYVDENGNRWLVCGQLQVLEHVHGPECFTTYELDDGEPEAVFMEAEEQPEEGGNQETETADDGVTDDSNTNPADDKPSDIDEAGDADTKDTTTDTTDTTTETNTETTTDTTETNTDQENQKTDNDEALPAAEEPHTVTYTGTRGAEKGGMTALAEIPEGALDANAQLVLGDADESAARMLILKVVNEFAAEGEERDISSMLAMDIGFAANGAPAAPQGPDPIRVTLRAAAIRGMSAPKMFHLAGGTAQEVKDVLFDTQAGTAVFTSADFSPFAIVDLTGEDAAEETAEDPVSVSMPARDFHEATDEIEVFVSAPEGAFPAGTTMHVTAVPQEDVIGALNEAANGVMVRNVQAVDISFRNAANEEIEPLLPISVKMSRVTKEQPAAAEAVPEGKESVVLHVDNDGSAKIVEDANVTDTEAEFESNRFSTYIMADFLTEEVIASNGENYRITVTYGAAAGIPENADLSVEELTAGSSAYEAFVANTESTLGMEEGSAGYIRLFDISIVDRDDNRIRYQPAPGTTVDVKIELADAADTQALNVVHFADDNAPGDVVNADVDGLTVSFEASGFSIYAIVEKQDDQSVARAKVIFQNVEGNEFTFLNNAGDTVDNQIIRSGSVLEEVGIPSIDVGGQTFQGWYIYDTTNNTYTSYQLKFGGNNTWTVSYGDTKSITSNTAVVTSEDANADGCAFYARPYFGEVSYLTFYNESAGDNESLGGHGIILNRIQVIENTAYDISEQKATPPDSIWDEATQSWKPVSYVFVGWSNEAGSDDDERTAITDTTITVRENDMSFYPIFKQGNWVTFDSAPTGSGATYIPAKIVLSTETTSVARPTVTPTWKGHKFVGWFTTPEAYDPDNANYRNADGTINTTYNGFFSTNESAAGAYPFNESLDKDLTLYAHWNVDIANVTVVKWQQVVTDDKNAVTPTKEQMAAEGYAANTALKHYEYAGQQNLEETVNSILQSTDSDITVPTGFNLNSTLSDARVVVKDDGTAVLNLYYDRKLITMNYNHDVETYAKTDATAGTIYGYVDGQHVRIIWNGTNWVYTTTEELTEYVDYTGTRYNTTNVRNNNNPQHYGIVNGRIVALTRYSNNYWYTGNYNQYTGTHYVISSTGSYGFVDGSMVELTNGQYQTTTTYPVEHIYYSGN